MLMSHDVNGRISFVKNKYFSMNSPEICMFSVINLILCELWCFEELKLPEKGSIFLPSKIDGGIERSRSQLHGEVETFGPSIGSTNCVHHQWDYRQCNILQWVNHQWDRLYYFNK